MDRYRLGGLRTVRDRDDRAKRSALAAAVHDARATAEDLAAASRRVADARAALEVAHTARTAAAPIAHMLALADRYVMRRRRELDGVIGEAARTHAAHAGRLGEVDAARGRLTAARADKEVIERHFARWRETQQKLAERRED